MALTYTPPAKANSRLADFTLPDLDGKPHRSIELLKGQKALVIAFICNHCPYVKAIEDRLIQLDRDLKALGARFVAVCSNDQSEYPEDSPQELKRRALEKNFGFLYLYDGTQQVARRLDAVCTPDFFVFDERAELRYRGRLDDSWKDPSRVQRRDLFEAVQKIIQGQMLSEPQIPSMGCSIKWITEEK